MGRRIEGESAQVGEGLAGIRLSGSRAASDRSDEVGRKWEAAIDSDRGRNGAAGVDHLIKGLLREERKGVPLRNAKNELNMRVCEWHALQQRASTQSFAQHTLC